MFKDARALDAQRTAAGFAKLAKEYSDSSERWFDGTIGSIDRRMDKCGKLIHSARSTAARMSESESLRYLKAETQLNSDHRALQALREDLLTGASYRENVGGSPGRRATKDPQLCGADRRWVTLEAARFLAANTDVVHHTTELLTRAQNHAALHTSTRSPRDSARVVHAFTSRVGALAREVPRPATVRTAAVMPDFAPEAMFL